jgi:hypothetical protein
VPDLPQDFKEKAFAHIRYLSGLGTRVVGSENEAKAIDYVLNQLREIGIPAELEPFEFETFEMSGDEFVIAGKPYQPEFIGWNPYLETRSFHGEAVLLDPQSDDEIYTHTKFKGKVVVTANPLNYFRLMLEDPALILYVKPEEWAEIRGCSHCHFILNIDGNLVKRQSANVVGVVGQPGKSNQEVILSAHVDAYGDSPGANDNGSGVGVLIELARYFKVHESELRSPVRFIVFSGEEVGILGSRTYIDRHAEEIKRCALIFNLDMVGSSAKPEIEMLGGVAGVPVDKGRNQFPAIYQGRALDGQKNRWKISDRRLVPPILAFNHPKWLGEIIQESARDAGVEFTPKGNLMSDQQAFAQAGIAASGIRTGDTLNHSTSDTLDQIDPDNLEKAGKIAAAVILKAQQRI